MIPPLHQLAAIAAASLLCGAAAWVASKFMDKAYLASTTVMMAGEQDRSALGAFANQLSGVTALLGAANIGTGDKLNEALATLRSHRLALAFLAEGERLVTLEKGLWPDLDRSQDLMEDRLDEAAGALAAEVLSVGNDARSGTITVAVTWFDPVVAARWANDYVALADRTMRERAINDARRSIEFLQAAAAKAESVDLRQAVFRVLESQINAQMLASTRPEFAFRIIDPATMPRWHVRPKSWLMAVAGGVLGATAAYVFFVLRDWVRGGGLRRNAPGPTLGRSRETAHG
jgi:uncharacterized protein involved in exopolysaccharide biosynthesis